MNYALILDPITPSEAASRLASVRQDRAREERRAFHRDLRASLGLPEAEGLA